MIATFLSAIWQPALNEQVRQKISREKCLYEQAIASNARKKKVHRATIRKTTLRFLPAELQLTECINLDKFNLFLLGLQFYATYILLQAFSLVTQAHLYGELLAIALKEFYESPPP